MQVIILCGGLGTRLRDVISDVPKPMAPINGVPFMQLQLDRLSNFGVNKVVFATGYKKDIIRDYFGDDYNGMEIVYSEEDEPLLTGGAMKQALQFVDDDYAVVMNGDIWLEIDLNQMLEQTRKTGVQETMAVKPMDNFSRFGNVIIADDGYSVIDFIEKQPTKHGNVNLGVYAVKKNIFDNLPELGKKFSHEVDYLIPNIPKQKYGAYKYDGYYIDIGIPEDYFAFVDYMKQNKFPKKDFQIRKTKA